MIKKIKTIKNMAVYKDFDWDKSIREKGNVVEFQRVKTQTNIMLYLKV